MIKTINTKVAGEPHQNQNSVVTEISIKQIIDSIINTVKTQHSDLLLHLF